MGFDTDTPELPISIAANSLNTIGAGLLGLAGDGTIRSFLQPDDWSMGQGPIGTRWIDLWCEEARSLASAALETALTCGLARIDGLVSLNGTRRRWRCALIAVPGRSSCETVIQAICLDISNERQFAPATRTDGLHEALIEATSEIVWHYDVVAGFTNRRGWAEFTGNAIPADEEFGWLVSVHPDDRDATYAEIVKAKSRRAAYLFSYRMLHRSGEWRWVEDHAVPIFDPGGRLTDWIGIVTDVNDRRTSEENLRRSERRLRMAIEATGLGIWDVDLQTGAREWSPELKEMLGLPAETEESEAVLIDRVHPDDREDVSNHNRTTFLQLSTSNSAIFRIIRKDNGETRWIKSQGRVLVDDQGRPARRVGTFQDVTEQHETRQALRLALRRHEAMVAATSEIVWQASADQGDGGGTGWTEFTGQPLDAANGEGWLQSVHPDDRAKVTATCDQAIATGSPYTNEYRLRHVSGEWRWVIDRVVPLRNDEGTVTEWVGIISDIHNRKTAEEAIRKAAHTDGLTGLANRTMFQICLDQAIERAVREDGEVALMLIDLDRFKEVNDSLGHDAGDHVLHTIAERLLAVVPPDATTARLGGDEFGVILPLPHGAAAEIVAGRILSLLKQPIWFAGRDLECSATIGLAVFPRHDRDHSALLKNADIALYAAKSAGRGQAFSFQPSMRLEMDRRISVLRNVKDALAKDAIVPFYQPKVSLEDGQIIGFEALLRWWDGHQLQASGLIQEAFGDHELSARIGERMLGRILSDMREWADQGIPFGHVAINVAAPEFLQPGFAELILDRLASAGLPPSRLEVEVTESVLIESGTHNVSQALHRLHSAGVAITLDDFGTGYASLTHLKKFPVTWLKVDRSFVMNLENDKDSAAIVQAVLGMAHNIGIRVVAEGVETKWQYQFLKRNGCDAAQGYLMARPMAASRVSGFLSSWGKPNLPIALGAGR